MKIKDIPDITEKYDFKIVCGNFLDDFKRSINKKALIEERPQNGILSPKELCMLACMAHKLANDNGIEIPAWVYDEQYNLKEPAYAFDTNNKEYQKFLEQTSPDEYKQRNLFYGENVLMRV